MRKIPTAIAFCVMSATGAATFAQTPNPESTPSVRQEVDSGFQQNQGDGPNPGIRGGRSDPDERIQRRLDRMTRYLELNEEQKTQIKAIMEVQQAKRTAMRQETQNRISDVLNEQQRAKFVDMRGRRGKGRPGGAKDCSTGPKSGRSS